MVATETGGSFAAPTELTLPANAGTGTPGAILFGVSCTSAGNCIAVGTYTDSSGHHQAMTATETGGSFATATELTLPANAWTNPGAYLTGVSCSSAGNCTMVGYYVTDAFHVEAMTVTETAGSFATPAELTLPSNANTTTQVAQLYGVSCASAGNCTAVGVYRGALSSESPMATTETGGTFAAATALALSSNNPNNVDPEAISCPSAGNCTDVGYDYLNGLYTAAVSAVSTGGTFAASSALSLPTNANANRSSLLAGVSCPRAGNCTTVGSYTDGSGDGQAMFATEAPPKTFAGSFVFTYKYVKNGVVVSKGKEHIGFGTDGRWTMSRCADTGTYAYNPTTEVLKFTDHTDAAHGRPAYTWTGTASTGFTGKMAPTAGGKFAKETGTATATPAAPGACS